MALLPSYIRDSLAEHYANWQLISLADIDAAIARYHKSSSERERKETLEKLAFLLLILLVRHAKNIAQATSDVIATLTGIAPYEPSVNNIVLSIVKQYWLTFERYLRSLYGRSMSGEPAGEPERKSRIPLVIASAMATEVARRGVMAAAIGSALAMARIGVVSEDGFDQEQAKELLSKIESGEEIDIAALFAGKPAEERMRFLYVHTNNLEGICPMCLPYVNRETYGDGTDDVPIPPQHPNCKCVLIPIGVGKINSDANPIARLSSLPPEKLARAIGPVRTKLVLSGKVKLSELFDEDFMRMKTLDELGYTTKGNKL